VGGLRAPSRVTGNERYYLLIPSQYSQSSLTRNQSLKPHGRTKAEAANPSGDAAELLFHSLHGCSTCQNHSSACCKTRWTSTERIRCYNSFLTHQLNRYCRREQLHSHHDTCVDGGKCARKERVLTGPVTLF
jgi:hypothetical protein